MSRVTARRTEASLTCSAVELDAQFAEGIVSDVGRRGDDPLDFGPDHFAVADEEIGRRCDDEIGLDRSG